jgi:hypothetical protein
MDISNQVDSIVAGLVRQIQTKLDNQVEQLISAQLVEQLAAIDFESKLNWLASVKLDRMIEELQIDAGAVQKRINDVSNTVIAGMQTEAQSTAVAMIRERLYTEVDTASILREAAATEVRKILQNFEFPARSIPSAAVDPAGLVITGAQVRGGVIQKFSSTGIDDRSSAVQMTLLDEAVVFENKMVTMGLEVKGTTVLEGDLVINGDIPSHSAIFNRLVEKTVQGTRDELNQELFEKYSQVIFDNIRTEGLDLNRITLNGTEVIKGSQLNYGIVDTNIQRLGQLQNLTVLGDATMNKTLYVAKDRVGVNTEEPGNALSVWDQEVEIGLGKRSRETAWIGTPRKQNLVIGSGTHDNLVLDNEGGVLVKSFDIDGVRMIAVDAVPNFTAPVGVIAWNRKPAQGSSIGWVSMGNGAWARFGILG